MDRSTPIKLIATTYVPDKYSVMREQTTSRTVFCNVTSVTLSEWTEGGRIGLNPEYRMTMFKYDYQKEHILEYNGVQYTIYRTYETKNDMIELYVEERKGNESKNS